VGLVGRFLGDLLGGQGLNGYSLLYSATLGLVAGLGYRRLTGFRNLRQLGLALGATLLACVLASLFATLLVETLIAHNIAFAAGLNQTLSQIVSGAIIALLLISTPLFVWDRVKKG